MKKFISLSLLLLVILIAFNQCSHFPTHSKNFLNNKTKKELSDLANQLLNGTVEVNSPRVDAILKKYNLENIYSMDKEWQVVEFGYYNWRRWFIYVYALNGLPPRYSISPIINENDIGNWGELVKIIKFGNDPSKYDKNAIVFEPGIAYPFLINNLDKNLIEKLKNLPDDEDLDQYLAKRTDNNIMDALDQRYDQYNSLIKSHLTNEEKKAIIVFLNKCRLMTKSLIENENIKFATKFHIGDRAVSNSLSIGPHIKDLISKKILTLNDDKEHLKIKEKISEREQIEIEWLNIEIMEYAFGNLLKKSQYDSDDKKRLDKNWYFYSW